MIQLLARATAIALFTVGVAACATPSYPTTAAYAPPPPVRPQYPIAAEATPSDVARPANPLAAPADPAPAPVASALPPPPAPASVQSAPLPPAAPAPSTTGASAAAPAPATFHSTPYASYAPAPAVSAYAPPPAAPTWKRERVTRWQVSAGGEVIRPRGMYRDYEVQRHDHVDAIARDLGTTRKVIVQANHLEAPYRLQPGQHLKIPVAKAYVAQTGDTLAAVARRFGVPAGDLAALNDLSSRSRLSSGERIALPTAFHDSGPIRERIVAYETRRIAAAPQQYADLRPAPRRAYEPPAPSPVRQENPPQGYAYAPSYGYARTPAPDYSAYEGRAARIPPRTYAYQPSARAPQPLAQPYYYRPVPAPTSEPPPASPTEVALLGRGRFIWPVHGEVISAFGSAGVGRRNDGVDLRSPYGSPVLAAAAGEVVYAGDQVPGFGNLVLVKHADGWVTAYAHLGRVSVEMRQTVAQGQEIGVVGESGGVTEPQLHFEIRYAASPTDRARPIDPLLLLPRSQG